MVTIRISITLFKDVMPYNLVETWKYFGVIHSLHLQDRNEDVLQMQTACSYEKLMTFYQHEVVKRIWHSRNARFPQPLQAFPEQSHFFLPDSSSSLFTYQPTIRHCMRSKHSKRNVSTIGTKWVAHRFATNRMTGTHSWFDFWRKSVSFTGKLDLKYCLSL